MAGLRGTQPRQTSQADKGDGEEDCEPLFYRGCWKQGFHNLFYFLPIQNKLERLLELL